MGSDSANGPEKGSRRGHFTVAVLSAAFESVLRGDSARRDYWRFPLQKHETFLGLPKPRPLAPRSKQQHDPFFVERLAEVLDSLAELEQVYLKLDDQPSRNTLIDVWKFRLLGPSWAKTSLDSRTHYRLRREVLKLRKSASRHSVSGNKLDYFEIPRRDRTIRIHCSPLNVLNTFFLEQYAYPSRGIRASRGNVVIDAGACWGDTALYFADRIYPDGVVYCYEFDVENLRILRENLALNPELSNMIKIVPKALWNCVGQELLASNAGPSTSVGIGHRGDPTTSVESTTIDSLLAEGAIDHLDFVKMDIEGAEPQALAGGLRSIRRFQPSLAVSVYHRASDFWEVPKLIEQSGGRWSYFLGHFTTHMEETVLFAHPKQASNTDA